MKKVFVNKKRYVDSVSLMSAAARVSELLGVENIEIGMATVINHNFLTELGYQLPEDITPDDLVVCVTAENEESCDKAIQAAMDIINRKNVASVSSFTSLDDPNLKAETYDLCQISLPGEYVFEEAKKAIDKGLDLFIFSDNVSLDEERKLKEYGRLKGKLVMGPDAGVGLINGVALATGSICSVGPVGIVGASGSGAQEVGCLIERRGLGVSHIIGTGGRDLYPEIGGITMLQGIEKLENDEATKLIVLVSKLADLEVMDKVLTRADKCTKPVVAVFMGSDETLFSKHKVTPAYSLEEAALKAVEILTGVVQKPQLTDEQIQKIAEEEVARVPLERKYFRGLYCGGTFTEEGLLYFSKHNKDTVLHSNLKNKYSKKLQDSHQSVGHTILDIGTEEFTAEAPHPVFNPELRLKRMRQELKDPEVAVVLLDFITGPGVAKDPITSHAKECKRVKDENIPIIFIANICGSVNDPQNIKEKVKLLKEAGVIVTGSNYESARLASAMMKELEKRNKNE
jgi:FdrA protein